MHRTQRYARLPRERRAYSLLEMTAVVAIIGIMGGIALMRFGHDTLSVTSAEGCVRQLALSLSLARRQAMSEGTPAAVIFNRDADTSAIETAQVARIDDGSGSEVITFTEATIDVPSGVTVNTVNDRWEFDYTGSLTLPAAGGTFTVDAPGWQWSLTINAATGRVDINRVAI